MRTREHKFHSSKKIAKAHEKFHHQFDFTITCCYENLWRDLEHSRISMLICSRSFVHI